MEDIKEKKQIEKKYKVIIRALKTRIYNPFEKKVIEYHCEDEINKPWPDLIKMALSDKKNRVFRIY